jgi:hypothetical protein
MRQLIAMAVFWCAALSSANAHLMPAQRGTLNLVGDGAYMVLSLPVTALKRVDDDGDARLSLTELRQHSAEVVAQVKDQVRLSDAQGDRPLDGVMLTLAPPDDAPTAPATQLVVMGRFVLNASDGATSMEPLQFKVGLFGALDAEKNYEITVTRPGQKQLLVLHPDQAQRVLFPSSWRMFVDFVVLGAEHIATGLDHLLFLLVVLAAGLGARQVLLALTCFTLGHAATLAISTWWGVVASPAFVEPAIAATIVGMAAFDTWARHRQRLVAPWVRLSLVFFCALIHGLGLATALTDLGLDATSRLPSLAGFNVGIELAQVSIALLAMATVAAASRLRGGQDGAMWRNKATQLASLTAMTVGSAWFVQRIAGAI